MATVPLSGTNVRFLSNIPFNNDYKNTRWFTSKESQTTYFQSKPVIHAESEMNFQRIEGKHFVAINKSIDELWGANYIMFQNAHYNNKWFYAFITNLEYKQRNNTHVHFEIDVLQTWKFDMNFKPSYVVREHRPLWNTDGTPVINTIDEGLNYGTDYDTVSVTTVTPLDDIRWLVIISKQQLSGDRNINATQIGVPQPLSYYVVPFDRDENVISLEHGFGETQEIDTPTDVLNEIFEDENNVNNVVSMYITDYLGVEASVVDTSVGRQISFANPSTGMPVTVANRWMINIQPTRQFHPSVIDTQDKYSGFKSVTESKLLMYPYVVIVLDDFKGNRIEIKPEFINDVVDPKQMRIRVKGSIGVSNFVSYGVANYNQNGTNIDDIHSYELENEFALINNSPEDVAILNDMLSAFLQGNRNSINTQKSQIMMNGVLGTLGSGLGVGASATAKIPNPVGVASSGLGMVQGMGNAVLDLQAIQSKQQDIANMPPQITKMGTNTSYNAGNGYNGIRIIKKQIKPEYIKILSDFFNMFGYKTNEVKIPNFRTRQHWNYVQTESCVITGNFNNQDLVELKNIFDSGITLWHTDDIGNYNLENGVI